MNFGKIFLHTRLYVELEYKYYIKRHVIAVCRLCIYIVYVHVAIVATCRLQTAIKYRTKVVRTTGSACQRVK